MIVLDSSVALYWILGEGEAIGLDQLMSRSDLAAPDVLFIEMANVLAKTVGAGDITLEQANISLELVRDCVAYIHETKLIVSQALSLSVALAHPVYDCCFLACAINLDAVAATRDQRFATRAEQRGFGARVRSFPFELPA